MFRFKSVRQIIGFAVAFFLTLTGVLITSGLLVPVFVKTERMQFVFGITVILFGIFRFVSAYYAVKRDRKWIEDDSWKGQTKESSSGDTSPPL